jgi:parallel beta-helix repeat protein
MKKRLFKKTVLLNLCLALFSSSGHTQNYFVSALTGSDRNDGLTINKPFATINKGGVLVNPGDTVFVMNGTYHSSNGPVLEFAKSGAEDQYITFKAYPGHNPKITAWGNVWNAIHIIGSYVVIDGFELQGNNANINYAQAFQSYQEYMNGGRNWSSIANFNTNGITIGQTSSAHNVIIRNCRIHHFPGGGINAIQADYITIESNIVYNNSWYCMYANSGISILHPYNSDSYTGHKIIIRNNISYNNKTTVPWHISEELSDGNGIIIDVNQFPANQPYIGRTLVENNISFNNGGSGIHAFRADHVDIINNTAYKNGTMVGYQEIFANSCNDVNILNNIMYARAGGKVNSNYNNTNVTYDYNIYYNGPADVTGTEDIIANPQFVNPSTDPQEADFFLQPTSPARNSGSLVPGQYSLTDINGVSRPNGIRPDRGAYEFEY